MTKMEDYPDWDEADKKGSFMKINDMLMKEVYLELFLLSCP
jgi:hypothetical protein